MRKNVFDVERLVREFNTYNVSCVLKYNRHVKFNVECSHLPTTLVFTGIIAIL